MDAMGFDKAELTFKALSVVYEAVHHTRAGRSTGTRAALRSSLSLRHDRKMTADGCKRFVACIGELQMDQMGHYMRTRDSQSHLAANMEAAGMDPNSHLGLF